MYKGRVIRKPLKIFLDNQLGMLTVLNRFFFFFLGGQNYLSHHINETHWIIPKSLLSFPPVQVKLLGKATQVGERHSRKHYAQAAPRKLQ